MRSHIGRLIWVVLTDGAFICLTILGYSHKADLQRMLHQERAVSFSHLIGNDPLGCHCRKRTDDRNRA
ncbi:MAG TPA: hypothetical protein VK579_07815 [Terriglobales bacterium]|nr:hypothetical protein [Terriglobales bacterium]